MQGHAAAPDWSTIPAPEDDGGARHLPGSRAPPLPLPATDGSTVDLSALPGRVVVYAYPRTGPPDGANPEGWDAIPGARGCTPQSCAFRDHFADLRGLGVSRLFGLSTQGTAYQREAAERLHLPFPLLSDERLDLARAMRLPTFEAGGMVLLKRLTLVLRTLGFGSLVDLNVAHCDRVLVESRDIRGVGVGQRVDVLERPERGVPSPRTLAVLVGHTGDTDRLLVDRDERGGGVEQVERVAELDVFRARLLGHVERAADLLHLFLRPERPQTLELGVVQTQTYGKDLG